MSDLPIFMGDDWLQRLIDFAAEDGRVCTRWRCTTCGAQPFIRALWQGAERRSPAHSGAEIAEQLGRLEHIVDDEAARCVICSLEHQVGTGELSRLSALFRDGPAGALYARMRGRHEGDLKRWAATALRRDPLFIAASRAERTAARAAAHTERVAKKAAREAAAIYLTGRRDGLRWRARRAPRLRATLA